MEGKEIEIEGVQIFDDRVVFRLTGRMSLDESVAKVTKVIKFTRERGIRKLLVDSTGLTGFKAPPLYVRYFFVQEWSQAAAGSVCIAMVARPEMIDPDKFGVKVAANYGLTGDVFITEQDAETWLQNR